MTLHAKLENSRRMILANTLFLGIVAYASTNMIVTTKTPNIKRHFISNHLFVSECGK